MPFALLYWILVLLWLVLGLWSLWPWEPATRKSLVNTLFIFVLFVLLGIKVFGNLLQD